MASVRVLLTGCGRRRIVGVCRLGKGGEGEGERINDT